MESKTIWQERGILHAKQVCVSLKMSWCVYVCVAHTGGLVRYVSSLLVCGCASETATVAHIHTRSQVRAMRKSFDIPSIHHDQLIDQKEWINRLPVLFLSLTPLTDPDPC